MIMLRCYDHNDYVGNNFDKSKYNIKEMFWEPGLWEKFLLIARKLPPRCRSNNDDDDDDDFVVEEECVCLKTKQLKNYF